MFSTVIVIRVHFYFAQKYGQELFKWFSFQKRFVCNKMFKGTIRLRLMLSCAWSRLNKRSAIEHAVDFIWILYGDFFGHHN